MFEYEITVAPRVGPHRNFRGGDVFSIRRHAQPEQMYDIVRRLRLGYPSADYAVIVDIIDVQRTTVIEE